MEPENFTSMIVVAVIVGLSAFAGCVGVEARERESSVSACYNVSDADARTMCLARAHREPGQCYSIQRPDLRAQCLAEVQR